MCDAVGLTPFGLTLSGKVLLELLENGVSQYPKLEGRFPQVAGVQFAFDPNSPPGQRIIKDLVKVGDEYLQETQLYRLCTKAYMRQGRDGYNMLVDCPVLVSVTTQVCKMFSRVNLAVLLIVNREETEKPIEGNSSARLNWACIITRVTVIEEL